MRVIVLDTDILSDNAHKLAPWVNELLKDIEHFQIIVPTIVVAEYLTSEEEETKIGEEKSRAYLSLFKMQDFTYEIAMLLGGILRRKTYVSQASFADIMIASTALYLNAELATHNTKDFAKIPDLRFFDPRSLKS